MKSFAQVMEETEDGNRNLLLGNGFSQAWNTEIFSYENLLEKADFGIRNKAIKGVFEQLGTYDFEAVMQTMISSVFIAQSFNPYPVFVEGIRRDAQCLKDSLVTTIARTHPSLPAQVSDNQYVTTRKVLYEFSSIFTVNYDLLLYWARNKKDLEPDDFVTDDGFRENRTWVGNETDQNVFFLHGGLHLYDESGVIKKHAYTGGGETIINQVRKNLAKNKFPIFVAEPDPIKKLDRILHNPYLNFCYESLGNISNSLVIYGHSMDETDAHIFEKASHGNIENVYVSIFGDPNSKSNRKTKSSAESYFHSCKVHFYQAESVLLWK
ncbi:MAG: DUF4917 family protein [Colwellia sp.]